MIRIVKDPDQRRLELLRTAEELFLEKGYDKTSVSAIVAKAGVAQGTFYYYFDSKEAILNAIVEELVEEMMTMMERVVNDESLGAVEKMLALFHQGQEMKQERLGLIDFVHQEKNELLHTRLEKKNIPAMAGYYERIIAQGVEEGVFDTPYPKEAALAIIAVATVVGHDIYHKLPGESGELQRLLTINLDITERILGAKPGSFMDVIETHRGE